MPIGKLFTMTILNRFLEFAKNNYEKILLIIVLIVSSYAHGKNMFGFPYFESDEGIYLSQAWSLLKENKLSPYTYWYDHAPMGWILTSFYVNLTGGLHTFGFALNSGRVFMLVIHILSTYLVFRITKQVSNSSLAATLAGLIFP